MTILAKSLAYMVIIYESWMAFILMIQLINYLKIMTYETQNVFVLVSITFRLLCVGLLVVGVIGHYRLMVKLWLYWAYIYLDWRSVGDMISTISDYFFTTKYNSFGEIWELVATKYGSLVAQIVTRASLVIMVLIFYKSDELPQRRTRQQQGQESNELPAKEKAK